jgi:hypothetical protein
MIDPQVFEQEIAILMDWYNRDERACYTQAATSEVKPALEY